MSITADRNYTFVYHLVA